MKLAMVMLAMSLMSAPRLAAADDIAAFWRTTLDQLAREPMDAKVESSGEALPYQSFIVTLRSLGGVQVRGRLALPVQGEAPAKPWPATITMPGYGGMQQGVMLSESHPALTHTSCVDFYNLSWVWLDANFRNPKLLSAEARP